MTNEHASLMTRWFFSLERGWFFTQTWVDL